MTLWKWTQFLIKSNHNNTKKVHIDCNNNRKKSPAFFFFRSIYVSPPLKEWANIIQTNSFPIKTVKKVKKRNLSYQCPPSVTYFSFSLLYFALSLFLPFSFPHTRFIPFPLLSLLFLFTLLCSISLYPFCSLSFSLVHFIPSPALTLPFYQSLPPYQLMSISFAEEYMLRENAAEESKLGGGGRGISRCNETTDDKGVGKKWNDTNEEKFLPEKENFLNKLFIFFSLLNALFCYYDNKNFFSRTASNCAQTQSNGHNLMLMGRC